MKQTVTKIFTFDMAHTLPGHEGLCKNLHGHTYKLEITAGESAARRPYREMERLLNTEEGMVIDFSRLGQIVKRNIIDQLDHSTVLYLDGELERDLYEVLKKHDAKVLELEYRPTAENMARDILDVLNDILSVDESDIVITKVVLWETPTSYAEVSLNEI